MRTCCATLKKCSKRAGQYCGKNAKHTHRGMSLCGIHMRPYKKLQSGGIGPPRITRRVNSNKTVDHVLPPIYEKQAKASGEIMEHFKAGRRAVFLAAQMQSGKTGTSKDTIVRFQEEFGYENSVASIVLTINDNDLVKQTQREFGSHIPHDYIFKATDLSSKLYIKTLIETYAGKKILIIIDESHYGSNHNGSLDKFFRSGDIGLDGCNLPKNVYLLTVSATGNAEVALTGNTNIYQYKRVVVLEPGDGYYGISNMLKDGSLRQGWKLQNHDPTHESWTRLHDIILDFCVGPPSYKIIRVNDLNGIKLLRNIVQYDDNIRFISYDQHSTIKDINEIICREPEYHTVIALAQKIKASKQLLTNYINMMYEYTTGNISTTVQGLPGRRCGYGKNDHNVVIYTNIKHCEIYEKWAHNGFKPKGTPSDKHVTNGVTGRASDEWSKNVPVSLNVTGVTFSTNYRDLLKQLKPIIVQQYPEIYAEYSAPISGTGILLITKKSKESVKRLWWDNIVSAKETGNSILGYPRSITNVHSQKGFFLFVNNMTNKVMLTYTKKGIPQAKPDVQLSCAYKPRTIPASKKIIIKLLPHASTSATSAHMGVSV